MSFFSSLKSAFGGKTEVGGRESGRTYLVDAEKLAEARDSQGRIGPVERFQTIQLLSRFADREKIEMVAVVGGRPLREVAHGESFNGVRVFYIEPETTMAEQIQKVLGGELRGRKPVVVTNDKQLDEKLVGRGVSTMRVTTLRKAFENGSSESDQGGRQQRRSRRGPRPERREQPQHQQQSESSQSAERDAEHQGGESQKPNDTIDNLIDRVD